MLPNTRSALDIIEAGVHYISATQGVSEDEREMVLEYTQLGTEAIVLGGVMLAEVLRNEGIMIGASERMESKEDVLVQAEKESSQIWGEMDKLKKRLGATVDLYADLNDRFTAHDDRLDSLENGMRIRTDKLNEHEAQLGVAGKWCRKNTENLMDMLDHLNNIAAQVGARRMELDFNITEIDDKK